jgi:hypothetical protein
MLPIHVFANSLQWSCTHLTVDKRSCKKIGIPWHVRGVYDVLLELDIGHDTVDQKRAWLETSDLRINRNEPLTRLLTSLRILFRKQLADIDTASVEVTYDALLAAIDYAESLPDWPKNDGCVAFLPYSGSKSAKGRIAGVKQKAEYGI